MSRRSCLRPLLPADPAPLYWGPAVGWAVSDIKHIYTEYIIYIYIIKTPQSPRRRLTGSEYHDCYVLYSTKDPACCQSLTTPHTHLSSAEIQIHTRNIKISPDYCIIAKYILAQYCINEISMWVDALGNIAPW